MVTGYKTEPVEEYEYILSNLKPALSESEEQFKTATLRMEIAARANTEGDVEKLLSEEINWGLDYLKRKDLIQEMKPWKIGKNPSYNYEWLKNGYTEEELDEVIDELES